VIGVPAAGKSVMHQFWPHDRPESGVGLALVRRPDGPSQCVMVAVSGRRRYVLMIAVRIHLFPGCFNSTLSAAEAPF
jgi:hypothetical protein